MAGASSGTQRVTHVNANWTAGLIDTRAFELLVVTEDGERRTAAVAASQMAALVALTQVEGVVLLWDPDGATLIAANLVGEWIPPTWSAQEPPSD